MKEIVFCDGRYLPEAQAMIPLSTPGFLHGFGVFETMRSYHGRMICFSRHLERIKEASKLIGINFPYSRSRVKAIIKELVKINGLKDARVRLTSWKAERKNILITAKRYHPPAFREYKRGFSAGVSRFRQDQDSFLARLKTTNRIIYELSLQEARENGFNEGIILNNRGYITEASRSNIFLVKEGKIFTPCPECGCLKGITRGLIFDFARKDNLKIYEGNFTLADLQGADEAFLTNSLMGVMPLVRVEKALIAKGITGRITRHLIRRYNFLLKNGI